MDRGAPQSDGSMTALVQLPTRPSGACSFHLLHSLDLCGDLGGHQADWRSPSGRLTRSLKCERSSMCRSTTEHKPSRGPLLRLAALLSRGVHSPGSSSTYSYTSAVRRRPQSIPTAWYISGLPLCPASPLRQLALRCFLTANEERPGFQKSQHHVSPTQDLPSVFTTGLLHTQHASTALPLHPLPAPSKHLYSVAPERPTIFTTPRTSSKHFRHFLEFPNILAPLLFPIPRSPV